MAKSSKYWDNRKLQRLNEQEIKAKIASNRIKKIYAQAFRNVNRDIASVYKNYSKTTGLDVQKLKTLLSTKETDKVWKTLKRQGLDQYVQDNYKSRINRLEQIQAQIYGKAKLIYPKEELEQKMLYKGVINDSYYKAIYDTQMGTGFDFSFNKLDNKTINNLLTEKWQGSNYSKRIWKNTDILAEDISELVGGALISGQSYAKTSRQLRDKFNVAKYYSDRLVRTETNYFNNQADAMAYEDMGIDKYVFVATLDNRTSEICQSMDNKVFNYKDMAIGENYPPLHPNCRSTTRGYLGKEAEAMLQRRAKNPITGEYETIPNMSYREWLKQYNITNNKNGMFVTKNNVAYNTNSLRNLDNKLTKTNAKQLDYLLNKYPTIGKYIKNKGLTFGGSDRTDAIAYTSYTRNIDNIGIYLEKRYYKNADKHIKVIKNGISKGNFMPCNNKFTDKYALTHEFGHVVETFLLNEYNINNPLEYKEALTSNYKWGKYKNKVYNGIRNDIIKIAIKNNANFNIDSCLSVYGKSSPAEFFAECFANAECGKPNELGKAIQEYLKGVL